MVEYQKNSKIVTVTTDATQERKKPRIDQRLLVKIASNINIKKPGIAAPMVNIEEDKMALLNSRLNGGLDNVSALLKHTHNTPKTLPQPRREANLTKTDTALTLVFSRCGRAALRRQSGNRCLSDM
jgi:hypothetical protein